MSNGSCSVYQFWALQCFYKVELKVGLQVGTCLKLTLPFNMFIQCYLIMLVFASFLRHNENNVDVTARPLDISMYPTSSSILFLCGASKWETLLSDN